MLDKYTLRCYNNFIIIMRRKAMNKVFANKYSFLYFYYFSVSRK